MNIKNINSLQCFCLVALFIIGDSLAMPLGVAADYFAFLAVFITVIVVTPILYMYGSILEHYKDKNLLGILYVVFGKYIGRAIGIFYIFYAMMLYALILKNQADFIFTSRMEDTPVAFIITLLVLLNYFVYKCNIEAVANIAKLMIVVIIFFIIIIILAALPTLEYKELGTLYSKFDIALISKGVFTMIAFPFTETVLFLMVLNHKACRNFKKSLIKGTVFSGTILGILVLIEFLYLGSDIYNASYYPIQAFSSKLSIGTYFHRSEIIGLMIIVLGNFIKSSICLFAIMNGITSVFSIRNERPILMGVSFFLANFSMIITGTTSEMMTMAQVYPYFQLHFSIGIPLLILIITYIKSKRAKWKSKL